MTITAVLLKDDGVEWKTADTQTVTAEYQSQGLRSKTIDFRNAIKASGAGIYDIRAYIEGTEGRTSDSRSVYAGNYLQVVPEAFGVQTAEVELNDYPKPGDTAAVTALRDAFGSELTGGHYQWYRFDSIGRTGSPVGMKRILNNATGSKYTAGYDDVGKYLAVLVVCNGSETEYWLDEPEKMITAELSGFTFALKRIGGTAITKPFAEIILPEDREGALTVSSGAYWFAGSGENRDKYYTEFTVMAGTGYTFPDQNLQITYQPGTEGADGLLMTWEVKNETEMTVTLECADPSVLSPAPQKP